MHFSELAQHRESCRSYDGSREVEPEKIKKIMECARLSPSACNGQPYHLTVCTGDAAREVAKATQGMGMNKFTNDAPVMIVISEEPYVKSAALGSKVKGIDYRSIDIGICAAYITAMAAELSVESCILGWLDDEKIRKICGLDSKVHLVICLGYSSENAPRREKKRKQYSALVREIK